MKKKMDFTQSLIIAFTFLCLIALNLVVRDVSAASIVSCPTGMKYQSNLCYQPCRDGYTEDGPSCRQSCRAGYSWDGISCSRGFFLSYYPESYFRRTESPTICNSESFAKTIPAPSTQERFTVIFSSDSQYPWWRGAHDPDCNSEACVKQKGESTNKEQIRSMNNITTVTPSGNWPTSRQVAESRRGQAITQPRGVLINGDLTAFWHPWQVEKYMDLYHRNDADPNNKDNLKLNLLPGLGNHDYANNHKDCWWLRNSEYTPLGLSGCEKNATDYIKKMVSCQLVSNFPSSEIISFDEASLAYSWRWGQYYFIQLHNYPSYNDPHIDISASITWLRGELQKAHDAGYRIVLNLHDFRPFNSEFLEAMAGKRVVAIFAGHIHESYGYIGKVQDRPDISFFRSGAAEYNTFLLAEFGPDSITVGVVDSTGGTPEFKDASSRRYMKSILFTDP